jgi:hypothetical protein
MTTTAELAERIAKRARILDPNESLTAQESDDVVAIMNSMYDSWKERGHIRWTLTEIPTRYIDPFCSMVALRVAHEFGTLTPEVAAMAQAGEREIYALNETRKDKRTTHDVDY